MRPPAIVDTSSVVALLDKDQTEHDALVKLLRCSPLELVISPFVVAECDYLVSKRFGADAALQFNRDVVEDAYSLAPWSRRDHAEALSVVQHHHEHVGITDAANVVLAARHRTTTILTLDQRHFRSLSPLSGDPAFRLLPFDS